MIIFRESFNREGIRLVNQNYRSYLKSEITREQLIEMVGEAECYIPDIYQILTRLSDKADDEGIDTGFNPGRWKPGVIAAEVI